MITGKEQTKMQNTHSCKFHKISTTLNELYPPDLKFSKTRRRFREFFLISEENGRRCFARLGVSGYIFEKEKQVTQYPYAIHPYSKFCQFWETLVLVEIFLSLMLRPFFISQFSWEAFLDYKYQIPGLCDDLFQMVDVGLRFVVGYVDKETQNVVLEFRKIFTYNIRRVSFYVRMFCSFPLEFTAYLIVSLSGVRTPILLFSVFMKIFKLYTFERYLRHLYKIYNWSELRWRFVWISIFVIVLHNWLSSFLYLAVFSEDFRSNNENRHVFEKDRLLRHLITVHLVCNTFFYETGFFSNILIYGVKDMIITSIVLLLTNFSSVIVVGMFVQLLGLMKTSRIQYAELLQEIRKFLSQENLPKHVHLKVEKYFKFYFEEKYFREKRILETLSPPLKREIAHFLCINLLINSESIFNEIHHDLAEALCQHMSLEIFLPGDDIIRSGKRARKMYFIYSGSVAIYSPNGKELLHLYEGQQFGESAFVTNNSYLVTVIALEMSECYVLLQSDFIKCLAIYPDHGNVVIIAANKKRKQIRALYSEEEI